MDIVMKRISEIIPYENNPRENNEAAEVIAESIREFGFKNPIILDADNVIVCGHARLKAAMLLGLEEVPTITVDELTPTQIRAFRIADNKTSELAGWDYEALQREFEGLQAEDFDLNLTGFNEYEQTEYGMPDAVPEKLDKEEFKEYQQEAENEVLRAFAIVITCANEGEKGALAEILHENGTLKRLYRADELMKKQAAAAL